jgi:hypothetical protein
MLDKIRGWPAELVEPYELSFQQDPDNSERQVKIIDYGLRVWVVRINNPNKLTWSSTLGHDYTFADLPEDCQVNGCDAGCPRRMTKIEQHSILQKKETSRISYQMQISPIREGSRISVDLPRIFGQQSLPLPALRWERLGYRGPKKCVDATKPLNESFKSSILLQLAEKRRQHFKTCSPPKRPRQDGIMKG